MIPAKANEPEDLLHSQGMDLDGEREVSEQDDKVERHSKKEELLKEARVMVATLLDTVESDRGKAGGGESPLAFSKMALKAFSSSETISANKFKNSGGLKSIAVAIRKYCGSSTVVESGCKALCLLSLYDKSVISELAKSGAVASIVKAISAQGKDGTEDSCVAALKVIRNLTQEQEHRLEIYKASGIESIVNMMILNPEKPRILSHASLVLSNLTFGNIEMKEAVGQCGGVGAIAKAMREFHDDQAVQARGSLALRNLCYQSEANQNIAGESKVADALLGAIESYIEDREVVHQSCVALVNVSSVNEINRVRIVEARGASIIAKLMKTYPKSLTVQDDCISIIRNIAVGCTDAQLELGMNGGIDGICSAMQVFPTNEKILDKSCTAIRYLCFLPENRIRVRNGNGIEGICASLKNKTISAEAIKNALLALGNATFESDENKSIVGRCGGISNIINAVQQQRLNAEIQEHGCRVLRNLADGFEFNRLLEAESGGIATGVFAMIGFPENASVQEQACAMLLNMSLSAVNLDKLEQADVRRLAEKAISLHAKHRGVQLQAGSLLDRMNGFDLGGGENQSAAADEDSSMTAPKRAFSLFRFASRRAQGESR